VSAWLSRAPSGTCRSSSSTSIQLLPTSPSRGSGGEAMGSVTRSGPPAADAHDPLRSWMCGIVSSASHCPATHTHGAPHVRLGRGGKGTQHWLPSPFSPRLCRRHRGRRMGGLPGCRVLLDQWPREAVEARPTRRSGNDSSRTCTPISNHITPHFQCPLPTGKHEAGDEPWASWSARQEEVRTGGDAAPVIYKERVGRASYDHLQDPDYSRGIWRPHHLEDSNPAPPRTTGLVLTVKAPQYARACARDAPCG
jgi:hypothetical protein